MTGVKSAYHLLQTGRGISYIGTGHVLGTFAPSSSYVDTTMAAGTPRNCAGCFRLGFAGCRQGWGMASGAIFLRDPFGTRINTGSKLA